MAVWLVLPDIPGPRARLPGHSMLQMQSGFPGIASLEAEEGFCCPEKPVFISALFLKWKASALGETVLTSKGMNVTLQKQKRHECH